MARAIFMSDPGIVIYASRSIHFCYCARSMRALSSQQPRFLNNLCAFVCSVCLYVREKASNTRSLVASASFHL